MSPEAMQARIQQARREAESLKDRIKRKKDELADTSRTFLLLRLTAASTSNPTTLDEFGLPLRHAVTSSLARCCFC